MTDRETSFCPACGVKGKPVSVPTLLHQLKQVWRYAGSLEGYYFCAQPGCDQVYFNANGEGFTQSALRHSVGIKRQEAEDLLCYCFGIHYEQADEQTRDFVIEQTRKGLCSCTTHNPSGRCCLADFPLQGDRAGDSKGKGCTCCRG